MDKVISEIADEEKVARILFSPSHVYNGRVSPKAFKLEKLKSGAEDYIMQINWILYQRSFNLERKVILGMDILF